MPAVNPLIVTAKGEAPQIEFTIVCVPQAPATKINSTLPVKGALVVTVAVN